MSDREAQPDSASGNTLEDEAIDRLVELQSGRASDADRWSFERWRRRSARHEAAARSAEALWADLGATTAAQGTATGCAADVSVQPRRWTRRAFLGAALAAAVGAVAVGTGVFGPPHGFGADHVTATGERRPVALPDGSQAWLNSASALALDFDAERRRVRLQAGEALFEVADDADRPFVVRAGDVRVEALGTTFSVRRRDAGTRIVVTESAVELQGPSVPAGMVVSAGSSARITAAGRVRGPEPADVARATAWIRGKLIFNARPLGEVVAELERHRTGRILVLDERLRRRAVSGVFPLDDPAAATDILEDTLDVRVSRLPWLTLIR